MELSSLKRKFLSIISNALGDDSQNQSKVYSTEDLLSRESLAWCGIGSRLEARKIELGFEEDREHPSWTLHWGRVFSPDCETYRVPNSEGCPTAHGR